jgi:hypothetical protein
MEKLVNRPVGEIIFDILKSPREITEQQETDSKIIQEKIHNLLGHVESTIQFHEAHGHPIEMNFREGTINGRRVALRLTGFYKKQGINGPDDADFSIEEKRPENGVKTIRQIFNFSTDRTEETDKRNGFTHLKGEISGDEIDAAIQLVDFIRAGRFEEKPAINFVWLHR